MEERKEVELRDKLSIKQIVLFWVRKYQFWLWSSLFLVVALPVIVAASLFSWTVPFARDDTSNDWLGYVGAVVGGVISGGLTLAGVLLTNMQTKKQILAQSRDEQEKLKRQIEKEREDRELQEKLHKEKMNLELKKLKEEIIPTRMSKALLMQIRIEGYIEQINNANEPTKKLSFIAKLFAEIEYFLGEVSLIDRKVVYPCLRLFRALQELKRKHKIEFHRDGTWGMNGSLNNSPQLDKVIEELKLFGAALSIAYDELGMQIISDNHEGEIMG